MHKHTHSRAIVTFFYPFRLYFILLRATMNIEPFTTVVFFTMIFPLALTLSLTLFQNIPPLLLLLEKEQRGELKCIHFHVYVWERKTFSAFFSSSFICLPITSFFLSTSISLEKFKFILVRESRKKLSIFSTTTTMHRHFHSFYSNSSCANIFYDETPEFICVVALSLCI